MEIAVAPMSTSGSISARNPFAMSVKRDVMTRHEAHEQIGTIAVELLDDLARDRADRLEGHRVRRERSGVARHRA